MLLSHAYITNLYIKCDDFSCKLKLLYNIIFKTKVYYIIIHYYNCLSYQQFNCHKYFRAQKTDIYLSKCSFIQYSKEKMYYVTICTFKVTEFPGFFYHQIFHFQLQHKCCTACLFRIEIKHSCSIQYVLHSCIFTSN